MEKGNTWLFSYGPVAFCHLMSYQQCFYCKWQKQSNPKGCKQKEFITDVTVPGSRGYLLPQCCHHTVMIHLSLCTDPGSAHLHEASFSEAFPLGLSWLHSSRPHFFSPSNLGAGRGVRGRHQVTFPEVSAKVPFHLIGAIVLYAHCGQRMPCFEGKVGSDKKLGLLAKEERMNVKECKSQLSNLWTPGPPVLGPCCSGRSFDFLIWVKFRTHEVDEKAWALSWRLVGSWANSKLLLLSSADTAWRRGLVWAAIL